MSRGSCVRSLLQSLVMAALVLAVWWPGVSAAQDGKLVLNLQDCITRSLEHSAEIRGAEYEVSVYRSKKEQADAARFAQVEVIAYGSLSPRARLKNGRTVESETNIHNTSYDGVFGRATVQLIQPLYTFGKISGYREAASHGVEAFEAGARLKATEVVLQVKEAYYGLLLAKESNALLVDLRGEVEKSIDKVSRQLDAGAPGVDQVDLFKLQTILAELDKYIAQAEEGMDKARFGLRVLTGVTDPAVEFSIADEFLIPEEVQLEDFGKYSDRALTGRPEFVQLREGLLARRALIQVERADYYPQLFAAGFASIAGATNRDHLNNPYIFDEFNHATGGVVLGLKWALDFGINKGQVNEARAEYMKLKMKEDFAVNGVPFQVKEAYLQYQRSIKEMDALSRAYKSAKQWVVAALSNFDMGLGEAKEIADSVRTYGSVRADYFRAVYNQKMAIANLEHAAGMDVEMIPYTVRERPLDDQQGAGSI